MKDESDFPLNNPGPMRMTTRGAVDRALDKVDFDKLNKSIGAAIEREDASRDKVTVRDVLIHTGLADSNVEIQRAESSGQITLSKGVEGSRLQYSAQQFDDASWATEIQVGDRAVSFNVQDVRAARSTDKLEFARNNASVTPVVFEIEPKHQPYIDSLHAKSLNRHIDSFERRERVNVSFLRNGEHVEGRMRGTVEVPIQFKANVNGESKTLKDAKQYAVIQTAEGIYSLTPATPELIRGENHLVAVTGTKDKPRVVDLSVRDRTNEAQLKPKTIGKDPKSRGPITR